MLPKENGGRRLKASTEKLRLVRPGAPANHRRHGAISLSSAVFYRIRVVPRKFYAFVPVWGRAFLFHGGNRMKEMLQNLREASIKAILDCEDAELLESLRVKYLGKK